MAEENQDEKTEEPTQHRLTEARKRGEIIYSTEAGTFFILAAGAFSLIMMGAPAAQKLGVLLSGFLAAPESFAVDAPSLHALFSVLLAKVGGIVGFAALVVCAAAIGARFVQDQPTWTGARLKPSLEKIDPLKGFGRVFGAAAFANFGKGLLKLIVVGTAATWALWPRDATYETEPLRDLAAFWPLLREKAVALIEACLVASGALAAADYFFTRQSYMRRMRMSRQDLREEFRQQEGDPQVRARLRQVRAERSRRRMLAQVQKASVVITNPTHFAVALRYKAGETEAPICLAKGVDDIAFKIRETAEEHSVPIVEDPPLARALYASAELDEPIPRQHYEAVAKVISHVMKLASRRRSRPAPGPNRSN